MKLALNNIFCFIVLILINGTTSSAQELTTKETKVIVVVNSITKVVDNLELMNSFQKNELFKKYPNHRFYYGVLKGTYQMKDKEIHPLENTTIIIYTNRQLFPEHPFYSNEELVAGDTYNIGQTKSKVVANKKGKLTLKTQKP